MICSSVYLLLRIALPLDCADSLLPWYGWRVAGQIVQKNKRPAVISGRLSEVVYQTKIMVLEELLGSICSMLFIEKFPSWLELWQKLRRQ